MPHSVWLAYSLHMMRAYAHLQVDRGGGMSVAGAAIRAACGNRADLAAVAYFFFLVLLCSTFAEALSRSLPSTRAARRSARSGTCSRAAARRCFFSFSSLARHLKLGLTWRLSMELAVLVLRCGALAQRPTSFDPLRCGCGLPLELCGTFFLSASI